MADADAIFPVHSAPDLVGAILMEDADSEEYWAVCEPAKPMAWRRPAVFAHLVAMAKSGRTVGGEGRAPVMADFRFRRMGTRRLIAEIDRQFAQMAGVR